MEHGNEASRCLGQVPPSEPLAERLEVEEPPDDEQRVHEAVGEREGGQDGYPARLGLLLAVNPGQEQPEVVEAEGSVGQEEPGGQHCAVHCGTAKPLQLSAEGRGCGGG